MRTSAAHDGGRLLRAVPVLYGIKRTRLRKRTGEIKDSAGSAMLESEGFAWAGRGCYADATATVKSCAKELRPFGIPRAAQGSSARVTVRKRAFYMLFCVHEKRPESTVFGMLFIGVTTGLYSRPGAVGGADLVPFASFAGADFFF